jgi:Tfp pilus assembly protein PilN
MTSLRNSDSGLLYGVLKRIPFFQRSTLLHQFPPYIGGFNLVPYRTRHSLQRRYKHSVGIAIAGSLGAVIAFVLHYSALHTMYLRTLQRAKLEQTLAHLRPQVALSANFQHAVKAQAERTDLALALTEQMNSFSEILQAIAEIAPLGVHLQRLQFTDTTTTIVGTAHTQQTLQDWLRRLQRKRTLPKVSITQVQRISSPTMPTSPLQSEDVLAHAPIRPPLPANLFQNSFLDTQARPSQTPTNTPPPIGNSNAGLVFTVQLETALKVSPKQGETPPLIL